MAYLRVIFPWVIVVLVIAGAALFYGSDSAAASLIMSAVVFVVIGLAIALNAIEVTNGAIIAIVVLFGFAIASWVSGYFDSAAPEYATLGAAGAVWLAGRSGGLKAERAETLWRVTLVIGSVIAAYHFFDFILSPDTLYGSPRAYHVSRLSGPFLSANTAATFYGLLSMMALGEFARALKSSTGASSALIFIERGAFSSIVLALSVTCLILTASRAGIAFFAASACLFAGWELWSVRSSGGRWGWQSTLGPVLGLLAAGVFFFELSGDQVVERFTYLDQNLDGRNALIEAYWSGISVAPWFGHGLGGFTYANLLIADATNARLLLGQGAAHNVYLQWLLQGGIVGFVAISGVIGAILWSLREGLERRKRQRSYLKSTICIAVFVGLHGWVDYALDVTGMMWWVAWVLGLGCGIAAGGSGRKT